MEEKKVKTSVSQPGKLSEGEIEANIQAILDDPVVEETLAKIGVSKSEIFRELAAKKYILPKKMEDEIGYAKRYIKYQVVAILASKYCNKIAEDKSDEVRKRIKEFSEENSINMKRGDAEAFINAIEQSGCLISKDGSKGRKLTQKQIEIITRKLRTGMISIDELLEQIELEDDLDLDNEKLEEQNIENREDTETTKEDVIDRDINESDDDRNKESDTNGVDMDSDSMQIDGEENADNQNKVLTLEDYNFRKATETEKSSVLELNQQTADKYRSVTFYVAPENVTLEEIARRIIDFQKNSVEGDRVVVSYNGFIIDPQEFTSPEQIIEEVKREANKNVELQNDSNNTKDKIKSHLKGITRDTINDDKSVSGLTPAMTSMREDAINEQVIDVKKVSEIDVQKSQNDEHPYPEIPDERG